MRRYMVGRQAVLAAGFAGLVLLSGLARANSALEWLQRAASAAKEQNYSGIYVYHHGDQVEVLRVLHRNDGRREQEKTEVMDGTLRHFLRVNNDVYCHLADGKQVRLERNASRRFFPAFLPARAAGLAELYEIRLAGVERVAGRSCQVVTLEPRDGYRHAFQLWLDSSTGLPLKSRIVNSDGDVVSMFVFSEVQIGRPPDLGLFRNDLAGKQVQQVSLGRRIELPWSVTPPPGFERVQEAVRTLPGRNTPVTHLVFSDGLSVLSMFIEPADPGVPSLQGLSAEGAIGVYARTLDGHTITTVGEVPNLALIETGNSVRRK